VYALEKKPRVGQYLSVTFSQRGGGERVQHAIYRLFGATIYTLKKRFKGKEYKEVGDPADRKFILSIVKV